MLKKWQKELINANENVIYVKHQRGDGVTTALLQKILNDNDNFSVLAIGWNARYIADMLNNDFVLRDRKIRNIRVENVRQVVISMDYGNKITINCYYNIQELERGKKFKYGICEGVCLDIPYNMNSVCNNIILVLPDDNYSKVKLIDTTDAKKEEKRTPKEIIEDNIVKILNELDELKCNPNTTMTRERLIHMIRDLEEIKRGM